MKGYRTERTAEGRKFRVRMDRQEIVERRILHALIATVPFGICWLFAYAGGMI